MTRKKTAPLFRFVVTVEVPVLAEDEDDAEAMVATEIDAIFPSSCDVIDVREEE